MIRIDLEVVLLLGFFFFFLFVQFMRFSSSQVVCDEHQVLIEIDGVYMYLKV